MIARSASICIAILGLLLGMGAATTAPGQSISAAKTVTDTVSLGKTDTVAIENTSGSIEVRTWARAAVAYEIRLEPSGRDSVVFSEPIVDRSGNKLTLGFAESWSIQIPGIVTISPGGTTAPLAHYRVRIPDRASLEIDDHDSEIDVSGIEGDVEIESHSGDIEADTIEGMVTLDTHRAAVRATSLCGGLVVEMHDGTVDASFDEFSEPSSIDLFSGTIRLGLPAPTEFTLRGELDAADLTVADAFGSFTQQNDAHLYGGGGTPLSIETFSGQIEIHPLESNIEQSTP